MEIEQDLITIKIDEKEEGYSLLKTIQEKCKKFIKDIKDSKAKTLEDYKKMVSDIETCSELNYHFLNYLKKNKISYDENGEKWDYKTNLEILKETLTNAQYQLLENENKSNPLEEIISILKEYVNIKNLKKKQNRKAKYHNLTKIYPKNFTKLNFPLVTGIERLRLKYYRDLIIEKNISTNCHKLKSYIEMIEKDKDIFNYSLDDYKFNPKIYLLILILTTTFQATNSNLICNFFTKGILDDDENKVYENIKLLDSGEYLVQTDFENKKIKGEDYILVGLQKDITYHSCYPLEILLLRNESYQKFVKDGGKGFLHKLNLYDSFISYIKYFIKSNVLKQVLQNNSCYQNIEALLSNDNFLEEMLDETHLRFLPFYGSINDFGYTNKDLLISFINSIPEIVENLEIENEDNEDVEELEEMEIQGKEENEENEEDKELENKIKNLTNICLLFSIGVKFITSLHEFIIHLVYGYLHYFSNKKIDSDSFKEENDDDGRFYFEKQLNGKKFEYLDINSVVVLLDGISCQKNLSDFKSDLNANLSIENLKKRIKDGEIKGFLKDFLVKYPIDFNYLKDGGKNYKISCRRLSSVGIFMKRTGSCTYGGGKAIKK